MNLTEDIFEKYYSKRTERIKISQTHFLLPDDYKFFIENYTTSDLTIGKEYFLIWNGEDLETYNNDYQIQEYLPACLAIGTNLGGEFIGIDFENSNRIILCPFGDPDKENFIEIGKNFTDFFIQLEQNKMWKFEH